MSASTFRFPQSLANSLAAVLPLLLRESNRGIKNRVSSTTSTKRSKPGTHNHAQHPQLLLLRLVAALVTPSPTSHHTTTTTFTTIAIISPWQAEFPGHLHDACSPIVPLPQTGRSLAPSLAKDASTKISAAVW
ncbi:unnamed protein product [Ectocarpus sp. 8 AP-2014]